MSDTCERCGQEYVVSRDIDGNRWRYTCPCERKAHCHKGHHPATHVYLNEALAPRRYACDEHGVSADDRDIKPPEPPPPPPPKAVKAAVYVPPKVEMRVVIREPKVPDTTVITKKIVEEDIKNDTWKVECTNCHHVHQFNRRKVTAGTEPGGFKVDCPKCGEGGYKPCQ